MKRYLSLRLLGSFQVALNEEPVTRFEYDKVRALLAYLAVEADFPHRRDVLTGLLWPEQPGRAARHSLSQALLTLRQVLGDPDTEVPFLLADRAVVQWNPAAETWLDVAEFEAHLAACAEHEHPRPETCAVCMEHRRQAAGLYRGDFLKGLSVADSLAFEEWATLQRERLHRLALETLYALTLYHEWRGELGQAREYARRQVELEPWREEAHVQLMRLLAHSGQRSAALAQYETCRRLLGEEFGAEPSVETTRLAERIRAAGDTRRRYLPPQPTPFIGRQQEVAETAAMLAHPDCRALTLLGPGGVGKTRLALQVAETVADRFLDGVYFVPLASLDSAGLLVTAIADALEFPFHKTGDPQAQLLDYLRQKELLLVLDSFESLPAGAGFVAEFLKSAPEVKTLITSRTRLNLSWEWVFELDGLAVPAAEDTPGTPESLESYSAVQLFVHSAARARRQFSLVGSDVPAVTRICRLVEGMPLALELAAAWVRVLSCQEIAAEIERGLDFLATSSPDLPQRHRSMRAVFDYSWRLLSADKQEVFCNLSVFRGGFSREAAGQIAGTPLPVLAALVDQSLLRRQPSGRYEMHELLRQYAAEKRKKMPETEAALMDRHGEYYAAFLQEEAAQLRGRDQEKGLAEIDREIKNVRLAWRWLLARANSSAIDRCLDGLFLFYDLRGWAREGQEAFGLAAESLEKAGELEAKEPVLARIKARQGRFDSQLAEYDRATQHLQESLVFFRRFAVQPEIAFSLNLLGEVYLRMGAYETAAESLQESLAAYQMERDQKGLATCLSNLGIVKQSLGQYETARKYYGQSLAIFKEIGDRWGVAACLHTLAHMAYELGAYQEAVQSYQESLTIKRDLDDRRGIASSLNNLGLVFYALGEYGQAEGYFQQSLALRRELGNRWGIATSLNNLGLVATTQQAFDKARQLYRESLAICREISDQPGTAIALSNLGEAAFLSAAYQEAEKYYQEGLKIFREIGHTRGMTFVLSYLGDVSLALAEDQKAEGYYYQALKLALEIKSAPRALDTLAGLAALLARQKAYPQAAELLALALSHPASEKLTLEKAQRLLDELAPSLPAEVLTAAKDKAAASNWEAVVNSLLAD